MLLDRELVSTVVSGFPGYCQRFLKMRNLRKTFPKKFRECGLGVCKALNQIISKLACKVHIKKLLCAAVSLKQKRLHKLSTLSYFNVWLAHLHWSPQPRASNWKDPVAKVRSNCMRGKYRRRRPQITVDNDQRLRQAGIPRPNTVP